MNRRLAMRLACRIPEEIEKTPRKPRQIAWKRAGDESDVSALGWKFDRDRRGNFIGPGQRRLGQERVVARVEHERRQLYPRKPRFRACASPVIVRVAKTVQRRRHDVV